MLFVHSASPRAFLLLLLHRELGRAWELRKSNEVAPAHWALKSWCVVCACMQKFVNIANTSKRVASLSEQHQRASRAQREQQQEEALKWIFAISFPHYIVCMRKYLSVYFRATTYRNKTSTKINFGYVRERESERGFTRRRRYALHFNFFPLTFSVFMLKNNL